MFINVHNNNILLRNRQWRITNIVTYVAAYPPFIYFVATLNIKKSPGYEAISSACIKLIQKKNWVFQATWECLKTDFYFKLHGNKGKASYEKKVKHPWRQERLLQRAQKVTTYLGKHRKSLYKFQTTFNIVSWVHNAFSYFT